LLDLSRYNATAGPTDLPYNASYATWIAACGFFNDLKMGVIKRAAEKAVFCFIKHPARQKS
jgi:hypothetical protein